jgi:hypothetical protein
MLELAVTRLCESPGEDDEMLWLYVSNVQGGALSTYEGQLLSSRHDPQTLENYPRWAEPAGALCARLLHAALKADPAAGRSDHVTEFSILVRIVSYGRRPPRLLERFDVKLDRGHWHVSGACAPCSVPAGRRRGLGAVTLRVLKQVYWNGQRIRKARPVSPRIYKIGNTPYVRISELPEPVQTAFSENMNYSGRPCVRGAPDAVFAWDWTDFLAGGR